MKTKSILTVLVILLMPTSYFVAFGQVVNDTTGPLGKQITDSKLILKDAGQPKLIRITTIYDDPTQATDAKKENRPIVAYPENILRFTITNPRAFLNSRPSDNARVVLYVSGVEMKGMHSDWMSTTTKLQINSGQVPDLGETATINIPLNRNDTTKAAWHFFYTNTNKFSDNFADLNASVGWQGMSELPNSNVHRITIVYYKAWVFWLWLGLYIGILTFFLIVAIRSNALKDGGGESGAYSLALTQLLFWTTLVIGAFIYTLVLTDIVSSFNNSILLLLGISIGTTGIAYVSDNNFQQTNSNIKKMTTGYFFKDILTDGTSYSVQRIQVFAWNLVLGMYFIIYTIANKSMPEFSSTMLFLAGISSASYLGAKGPENNNLKSAATPPGSGTPPAVAASAAGSGAAPQPVG